MHDRLRLLSSNLVHVRLEWRLNLLSHKPFPVDVREPRMIHQIISVILGAESLCHVPLQQLDDDVLQIVGHWDAVSLRVREYDVALPDQVTQLMMVLVHERRSTGDHLVDQDAQRPPINSEVVALHVQDLRSEVLGSSTERLGVLVGCKELGESKVGKFDVARLLH